MITWMKKVNNFQIAKVQPQGVAHSSKKKEQGSYSFKPFIIKSILLLNKLILPFRSRASIGLI